MALFLKVFVTVFLAELGDKTQLATLLYAADGQNSRLTVFLSSSAALIASSLCAVLLGAWISARIQPSTLTWLAGLGFIAVGVWTLWSGLAQKG